MSERVSRGSWPVPTHDSTGRPVHVPRRSDMIEGPLFGAERKERTLMPRRFHAGTALFAAAITVAACGSPPAQPDANTPSRENAPPPLPGESTITGRIKYEGTAPTPRV